MTTNTGTDGVSDAKQVSKSILMRERRQLRRRVAALIVSAMANSDCDFKKIAKRCGRNAQAIRRALHALIDGKEIPMEIEYLSDVLLSMRYEPLFNVTALSEYAKEAE